MLPNFVPSIAAVNWILWLGLPQGFSLLPLGGQRNVESLSLLHSNVPGRLSNRNRPWSLAKVYRWSWWLGCPFGVLSADEVRSRSNRDISREDLLKQYTSTSGTQKHLFHRHSLRPAKVNGNLSPRRPAEHRVPFQTAILDHDLLFPRSSVVDAPNVFRPKGPQAKHLKRSIGLPVWTGHSALTNSLKSFLTDMSLYPAMDNYETRR